MDRHSHVSVTSRDEVRHVVRHFLRSFQLKEVARPVKLDHAGPRQVPQEAFAEGLPREDPAVAQTLQQKHGTTQQA